MGRRSIQRHGFRRWRYAFLIPFSKLACHPSGGVEAIRSFLNGFVIIRYRVFGLRCREYFVDHSPPRIFKPVNQERAE